MSDVSGGAGWWQASDGKWYRPEQHPSYRPPPVPPTPPHTPHNGGAAQAVVSAPVIPAVATKASAPLAPVTPPRQWDGFSGFVGQDRSPASVIGLSVVTLGIYYFVWYYQINAEIRTHDPEIQVTPGLCVLAALVPIASVVSAFSTASRIRQMQLDEGQTETISPVVAMLLFMFTGIGFPLYVASELQAHWRGHRRASRGLAPAA